MFGLYVTVRKNQYYQIYSRQIQSSFHLKKAISKKPLIYEESPREKKSWWLRQLNLYFGKYLLVTNTISSGVLMSVGDLIQQQIEYVKDGKHEDGFDWKRNINMGIVGTVQGPCTHFFYQVLDKYLPGVKFSTIAKKIFIDQTLASPFCIVLFFLGMSYLNNDNFEDSKKELKDKFLIVYAADCSIWIPTQFINFYWISTEYRVIYINLVTMCYNIFLSFVKHNEIGS